MITINGYKKDPMILPEGIVITWSNDLINEKGGLRAFIRHFQTCLAEEGIYWMQKQKNPPTQDILYVYIILNGRIAYRCYYGGHEKGLTRAHDGDGRSWSNSHVISWPRILLAGPIKKAPVELRDCLRFKGFQGFRYCTKLF